LWLAGSTTKGSASAVNTVFFVFLTAMLLTELLHQFAVTPFKVIFIIRTACRQFRQKKPAWLAGQKILTSLVLG